MDKNEKKKMSLNDEGALYTDVCGIIDGARGRLATYINAEICMTNWYVGKRIKEDVLDNQRASYGKQVVRNLATKLTAKYGNGWGYEKLKQCIRCADLFSDEEIGYAVRTQLSWPQLRSLMGLKDALERQYTFNTLCSTKTVRSSSRSITRSSQTKQFLQQNSKRLLQLPKNIIVSASYAYGMRLARDVSRNISARFGACHDTRLQLAGGWLLASHRPKMRFH